MLLLRHKFVVPRLPYIAGHAGTCRIHGQGAVTVQWTVGTREVLILNANLSAAPVTGFALEGDIIFQEGQAEPDGTFGPWSLRWSLAKLRDGDTGAEVSYSLLTTHGASRQNL